MSCPTPSSTENLHAVLNPRSLAVIGVSRNPDSFGYPLVEIALRCGYAGPLYPVNPKADSILGRKCYASVLNIPGEVDTAIIMVPRKFAGQAVEECIQKGVKGIVMITAGFAEQGEAGREHQDELVEKARAGGVRIIGPNTLGFFSAPVSLDAIMSGFIKTGHTALITQSGNLTQSLTFPGAQRGLGFRYVVGLGNQADVQHHDLIRFFRDDPETRAIAVHIEGLRCGRRFMDEVRATVPHKPVVIVKSGRTEKGAQVAASHTAAIAGRDEIVQAAFRQCGALTMESFRGLTSALLAFEQDKPMRGNRVCILSEGGGDCAWASDACLRNGLEVPELSDAIQARLRDMLPPHASVMNPVDLAGWENFTGAVEVVLEDKAVDGVLLVGGFAGNFHISPKDYDREEELVTRMCDVIDGTSKPVLIYSYSGYKPNPLTEILAARGIPLFLDHHDAVEAMTALARYHSIQSSAREAPAPPVERSAEPAPEPGLLLEPEAKQLLRQYDIPCPPEHMARNEQEAREAARAIGFPVALKIVSRDIVHKSDIGGVRLHLNSEDEVGAAFREMDAQARHARPDAEIAGMLVAGMDTEDGVEVILGGMRDPTFGPVLMFGLGGVFVETFRDAVFRVCPLTAADARAMLREIKGFPLLAGTRGRTALDLESLERVLLQGSRLLMENPWISEMDLNPVKVHANGLLALDARIIAG